MVLRSYYIKDDQSLHSYQGICRYCDSYNKIIKFSVLSLKKNGIKRTIITNGWMSTDVTSNFTFNESKISREYLQK